jgi:hypothetical protein
MRSLLTLLRLLCQRLLLLSSTLSCISLRTCRRLLLVLLLLTLTP